MTLKSGVYLTKFKQHENLRENTRIFRKGYKRGKTNIKPQKNDIGKRQYDKHKGLQKG